MQCTGYAYRRTLSRTCYQASVESIASSGRTSPTPVGSAEGSWKNGCNRLNRCLDDRCPVTPWLHVTALTGSRGDRREHTQVTTGNMLPVVTWVLPGLHRPAEGFDSIQVTGNR